MSGIGSDFAAEKYANRRDIFWYLWDHDFADRLEIQLRRILANHALSPQELVAIAALLLFLKRLPKNTPGLELAITIGHHVNQGFTYSMISIEEHLMSLTAGGTVFYEPGMLDSYTSVQVDIGVGAYLPDAALVNLFLQIESWIAAFEDVLGWEYEIKVDGLSGLDALPWEELTKWTEDGDPIIDQESSS